MDEISDENYTYFDPTTSNCTKKCTKYLRDGLKAFSITVALPARLIRVQLSQRPHESKAD